ncbi:MAG: DUF4268 domain-containing protein [SAR202 cluster bacterium]|nr:DUF4268 domain-containing protein [SAR202 cluster bacterium]
MAVQQLGRLVYLEPHKVWQNESTEFIPWIQQNVDQLSAALGIDIQAAELAVRVSNQVADLAGEEAGSGRTVVIESQLGRSDHDQLGRLVTYSAWKEGGVLVWVSPRIQPEHRRAMDWLNQATGGQVSCYGVELEVVQIGDAARGVNYKVVVSPKQDAQPSERDYRYQGFFQDMLDQMKVRRPGVTNVSRAGYSPYLGTPSGRAGSAFRLAFTDEAQFRIELYNHNGHGGAGGADFNKQVFNHMRANESAIEKALGSKLLWERPDAQGNSCISWAWDKPVTIMDPPEKLNELKRWSLNGYFRFRDAVSPYLRNLPSRAELVGLPQLEGLEVEESNPEPVGATG